MPAQSLGTPGWVELGSPDPDASVRFYQGLFGWEATEPGPAETGGYRMFLQGGRTVAGLMGLMQEGQPPCWSTYVLVEDADATVDAVRAAGGVVHVEPMDITDIGRMAFFGDPAGAVIGVWQPKTFAGADLMEVPVSLCWIDLSTPDTEAAGTFYEAVFGWKPLPSPLGSRPGSVAWTLDGTPIAGMAPTGDGDAAGAAWGVCFAVEDADAIAAAAPGLGGTVDVPPTDIPVGRLARLRDPHGVAFSVLQPAPLP